MFIGLDIGASWIKTILWSHNSITATKIRTPKNLGSFKKEILKLVKELQQNNNLKGIGIGLAGFLNAQKPIWCPNIPYLNNFPIVKFVAQNTGLPVVLDNDARCFLRAEITLGAAKNSKSTLGITIGSGLGGAIALDKQIIFGAHNIAGEIGHTVINKKELEALASAKFIKRHPGHYKELGENLALGVVNAVYLFDPEYIIVGGGFMNDKNDASKILRSFKSTLKKFLKNKPSEKVVIKPTALGEFAGCIGAGLLMQQLYQNRANRKKRN